MTVKENFIVLKAFIETEEGSKSSDLTFQLSLKVKKRANQIQTKKNGYNKNIITKLISRR